MKPTQTQGSERCPQREARAAGTISEGCGDESGSPAQDTPSRSSTEPGEPEASDDDARRTSPGPAFLSVKQFAVVVGLSENTVLRRIQDKAVRAIRIGRLWRIPLTEVERLHG
jgi:excisionase family DNA binding protein